MSAGQVDMSSCLLSEYYGEVVQKVGVYLITKGPSAMKDISRETGIKLDKVKKSLLTLIQHNMVEFEANKKNIVEYNINIDNVAMRTRFPRYIYAIKMLYGETVEFIVEEMLKEGQIQMSKVIPKITDKLNEELPENKKISQHDVREKFVSIAHTHFIQRCPTLHLTEDAHSPVIPSFSDTEDDMYIVPPLDNSSDTKKRKRSVDDESSQPAKKIKTEHSKCVDDGICWRVHYDRFNQYLKDQTIISAVARKIDKRGAEVVRTILRLSEVTSDLKSTATNPLSYNEIYQTLPKEFNISNQVLDQYLKLLVEDSMNFVHKVGDHGGGMYSINFQKAFQSMCKSTIESVIQERFGSRCLRIFRLLIMKKHLEQKQIEEFAMVPAKEAKEMLYQMFGENFITLTEVPKTPDHAPSRTFYLFSVDINSVARKLLERCYKTVYNLTNRREYETKENKRLLDKQQRVDAIAASLDQNGADGGTQKEEIQEMITPNERTQLNKIRHITHKLEQSEIQVDETIFVLQTYLSYAHGH